jgi:predicted NBD/HSP70 family sugar kinase
MARMVQEHGAVSRTDLGTQTGYSPFLVSKLTLSLLREGFLRETGAGASTGGRPPTLLTVNPALGRLVGLHIGTINCRIAITDMTGTLLHYRKVGSRVLDGPDASLPYLASEVNQSLRAARVARQSLKGIGIGISGLLDRQNGTTLFWPKAPRWADVPVRNFFEKQFRVAVMVDDTPRTMATAERRWGAARDVDSFVYVTVGAGVGSSLFLGGGWYSGSGGFAGELGHLTIVEDGPLCSCGNRGCLEALVSANALIRRAQSAVRQAVSIPLWSLCDGDPARISVEMIAKAAETGDRFCSGELERAGRYLGLGVAALIHLLNPRRIVLGGGLAKAAGPALLQPLVQTISRRTLRQPAAQAEVVLSTLQESDWARGAAFQVAQPALDGLFQKSTLYRTGEKPAA